MKILKQLCQLFKGAEPLKVRKLIVHEAKWDPAHNCYVVGPPPRDPNDPVQRNIDDGDIPPNWHQCFYYDKRKNEVTGSVSWVRCRNLAGPGLKPSFCATHAAEYRSLHIVTEQEKREFKNDIGQYTYCKHGPCLQQLYAGQVYCQEHEYLVGTGTNHTLARLKPPAEYVKASEPVVSKELLTEEEECGCYGYCEKHFNGGIPRTQEQIEWDAITEDVDWDYCAKIGWGEIKYRRGRKTGPMQPQETVHFKLEMRGSRDEIDLFHAILKLCDSDYPLDPFRKMTANPEKCANCGGFIWKNAIVTPVDIKKAAKQAGINIKVRTYLPESTCKKKERVATA